MKPTLKSIKKFYAIGIMSMISMVYCQAQSIGGYNVYYGHLHNHCSVSDGTGTIDDAYNYAKNTAGLDFFGLSDHASAISATEWDDTKSVADSYNQDGVFVTFRGFEWSHSTHGHVTIINTNDYCTAGSQPTFQSLLTWISSRECAAFLNHPGRQNSTGEEFGHLADTPLDKVVGMELWNKTDGFTRYYYNDGYYTPDGGLSYIDEGNTRGWKIGAGGSEDNHTGDWGTRTNNRMAILADNLTRTALYEAIHARRFFTTLDKNIMLSFKIDGNEMGSTISGAAGLPLQILAGDGENEVFSRVELFKNGLLFKTWYPDVSNVNITESLSTSDGDYYYVKVTQSDGDEAISSSVFVSGGIFNESPLCAVLSPTEGTHYNTTQQIVISADASDTDGQVESVDFYVNGGLAGSDNTEPYELNWSIPQDGAYTIYAKATDDLGATGSSAEVNITVGVFNQIISRRIITGNDDVEEGVSGAMYMNSSDLELVNDTYNDQGDQTVGIRFTDLGIPQGATIVTASIDFIVDEVSTGTCNLLVEGHDNDNSGAFSSTAFNVSGRARTSTGISWNPVDWSSTGIVHTSPDLKGIVQEIVDRPGFTASSAITFIITGTGRRTAEAYEGSSSQAALLNIEYSIGSENTPPQFHTDIIAEDPATEDSPYTGASLSDDASDPDPGDVLTFSKVDGPAWLNIASDGSLSGTPAFGDIGTNTWNVLVTDKSGATDGALLKIEVAEFVLNYCPSSGDAGYEFIAGVSLDGIEKTSISDGSGYHDYTASPMTTVEAGKSYPLILTPGWNGRSKFEYWGVWIDFDCDGEFETGERVLTGGKSKEAVFDDIYIPSGINVETRMRVSMARSSVVSACGDIGLGEVEDYLLVIGIPNPQPPLADFTADPRISYIGESVQFTDLSTGGPTSWSWTFGDGGISSVQNPVHVYSTFGVYTVSLEVSNLYGNDTYTWTNCITVEEQPVEPYCESSSSSNALEWISNVDVSNLSNVSGPDLYSDFTGMVAVLNPGSTYSITITPAFSDKAQREFFRVWIDFNQNGLFTDTEETVLIANNKKDAVTASFTVPAELIGTTRMRVSMKGGSSPAPCEYFAGGEVEDYTVDFGAGKSGLLVNQDKLSEKSFNIYPNPTSDILFIDFKQWEGKKTIKLIELTGKTLFERNVNSTRTDIDLSSFPKGIYFLEVNDGTERRLRKISKM